MKSLALNYRERHQTAAEFLADVGGSAVMRQAAAPADAPSAQPSAPAPPPAVNRIPVAIRGTPYVRLYKDGQPGDTWILPMGMNMAIGRDANRCNIIVDDSDVSRTHCVLRFDARSGGFTLTDVSSNGTFLKDGPRLPRGTAYSLAPGTRFTMAGGRYEWEAGVQ
jgi:hypothetical protein